MRVAAAEGGLESEQQHRSDRELGARVVAVEQDLALRSVDGELLLALEVRVDADEQPSDMQHERDGEEPREPEVVPARPHEPQHGRRNEDLQREPGNRVDECAQVLGDEDEHHPTEQHDVRIPPDGLVPRPAHLTQRPMDGGA